MESEGRSRLWAMDDVEDSIRKGVLISFCITRSIFPSTFTAATPTLYVADPVLLKQIMVQDFSSFPNSQVSYQLVMAHEG